MKRLERNNQKQIWKERLNLFKNDKLTVDVSQWIADFEQILERNSIEQKQSEIIVVDHTMWYFAVLLMASSGHLNKEQYEYLLNFAIQSSLFNSIQKFYFQFYLNQGQAPITIKELNDIKMKLERNDIEEKKLAYEQIKRILDRSKPNEEVKK
jgi:integrase